MGQLILKIIMILALVQVQSCDSSFSGDGDIIGSGGGGTNFNGSGDGTNDNNGDGYNNNPYGTPDAGLNGGVTEINGIDTRNYLPATATVARRDQSSDPKYDQRDVIFKYKVVGSSRRESGQLPNGEGSSVQIPRVCPEAGGTVKIEVSMIVTGTTYKPNKNNVGGIIGDRITENNSILIAIEKEAVNDPAQPAYHSNDDFVVEIKCEKAKIVVKDLCVDKSILHWPAGTCGEGGHSHLCHISDLVNDKKTYSSSKSPARNCGT